MKQILTKELNRLSKQYIIDSIDNTNYEDKELTTDKEKLSFFYNCFKDEYSWNIERLGSYQAFKEWLQGLPAAINIVFTNYDIIKLAEKWKSLSEEYTDKQAEKIIGNWFNLITAKSFQLFRKHHII